ncbi:MAG: hypothetical protein K0R54_664 [Clostridiaceae bacterium]|jgi:hypothetical protein|nr:hypothetical protein [Clostridiaceae bacterium]
MNYIDKIMNLEIFKIISPLFTKDNTNIILLCLIVITAISIIRITKNYKRIKKLYNGSDSIEGTEKENDTENKGFFYINSLKESIADYYFYKKNKRFEKILSVLIYMLEFISLIVFFVLDKAILGVLMPLLIHFCSIKLIQLNTIKIDNIVQQQLPYIIKHFVKFLSKDGDLKTVVYETSRILEEPLRSSFFDLSRKMLSGNYEKCLMEFADEMNSVWIHSFVSILISYKEQSKKEDIIANLRVLADIIDKENNAIKKSTTENVPTVIINYGLGAVGVLGFFGNLMLNPDAKVFFFESIMGLICLIAGISAIFGTVLINSTITAKNGRR